MTTFGLRKDLKPLTNLDLLELVNVLEIKNFRGIFMRDTLPPQGIGEREERGSGYTYTEKSER